MIQYIIFAFLLLNFRAAMVGGFKKVELSECLRVRTKALGLMDSALSEHQVTSCAKQLVNGLNYKMTLVKEGHSVPECEVVVWHDFQQTKYEVLEGRQGERDCISKLKEAKKASAEEEV